MRAGDGSTIPKFRQKQEALPAERERKQLLTESVNNGRDTAVSFFFFKAQEKLRWAV